jgi:hypothetical protein
VVVYGDVEKRLKQSSVAARNFEGPSNEEIIEVDRTKPTEGSDKRAVLLLTLRGHLI